MTRFVKALVRRGNPDDAAALYSFNWEVVQQNGFTRNPAVIEKRLRELRKTGGTAMYDAILLASRDIEDRQGRKVLVIVTDGGDTVSRADIRARGGSGATGGCGDFSRAGGADQQ